MRVLTLYRPLACWTILAVYWLADGFKRYALDTELTLPPGATRKDVVRAMTGHILAEGQLMGTDQRR